MRGRDEHLRDEILVPRRHARAALAAAPLRTVRRERHALDVALVADGDDDVLALDEVFVSTSPSMSTISVLRGVANCVFTSLSSLRMISKIRARDERMSR